MPGWWNWRLFPDYFFHNAGLINLSRYLAKMHAGKNTRFNCISPGPFPNLEVRKKNPEFTPAGLGQ